MPVGFNSPARNLFLLGSSGAQVVTNFFKTIDQSGGNDGVYLPDEIKYNEVDQKFVLAGSAEDSNSKGFGWFEKRDEAGTADFENRIESTQSSANTTLSAMELDSNNNLIVVGKTGNVPWIAKYSNGGVVDWQSTTNSGDVGYTGITSDSNGQYYACGSTPVAGEAQAFVEKFDGFGNPGWGKSAFMLGRDVVLNKVAANTRGEVVAVGYLEDDVYNKGYIVKIDTNTGEVLWDRTLSPDWQGDMLNCTDVYIDINDQIYVTVNGNFVGYLLKYTAEGNMIWQRVSNDSAASTITFDQVKSDGETEQTIVFGTYNDPNFNDTTGLLSKYSKDGSLVWRRTVYSNYSSPALFSNVNIDADPSFYYLLYIDSEIDGLNGTPDRYTFGKVSSSGNGLGAFQYDDGTGTPIDYEILSIGDTVGRLSDGSVRQDTSDLITYPFNANKILFDDLATQVSNKKRQMDDAGSFEYSGSPAIRTADFQELNLLGSVYSGSGDWLDQSGKGNNGVTSFTTTAEEPFSGAGSVQFDGTNDNLSISSTNIIDTNSFTVECFARPQRSGLSANETFVEFNTGTRWIFGRKHSAGDVIYYWNGSDVFTTNSGTISANQWSHLAWSKDGTTLRMFVNGVLAHTQTGVTGSFTSSLITIGENSDGLEDYQGYISNFRIVKGTALYTSNFTPPSSSLTVTTPSGKSWTDDGTWSWSNGAASSITNRSNLFDGDITNGSPSAPNGNPGQVRYTFSPALTGYSQVRIYTNTHDDQYALRRVVYNGASGSNTISTGSNTTQWVDITGNLGGTLNWVEWGNYGGSDGGRAPSGLMGIEVDGTLLVDNLSATQLLTAQGASISDASDNSFSITVNGNAAVAVGGTNTVAHNAGGWFEFDGVNDYIQLPTNSDLTFAGDFSYETWLWTDVQPASNHVWSLSNGQTFQFTTLNSQQELIYYSTQTGNRSFGPLANNTWAHYVITKFGNTLTGYLNGAQVWTSTPGGSATHDFSGASIGYRTISPANVYYWDGRMGEIRIYPRALTAAQVFQNYNATKLKYINEAPDTAPKIGPGIVYDSNLLLNYDFGNRATYDRTNQNLVPYSQGDNWVSNWTNVGATILSTTERSPVGTNDAVKYTGTGFVTDVSMTLGKTYVWSLYVKVVDAAGDTIKVGHGASQYGSAGTFRANIRYNLSDWSIDYDTSFNNAYIYDVVSVGDGWYRIGGKAYKGDANQGQFEIFIGSMNATVMIWGPQLEEWENIGAFDSVPPKASRYFGTTGTIVNNVPTTVKNLSSSSYTGTISPGTTFNSAGYFDFISDTTSQIVTTTGMMQSGDAITWEAWIYHSTSNPSTGNPFGYGTATDTASAYAFNVHASGGNGYYCFISDGTQTNNSTDTTITGLSNNTWYHIAYTVTANGGTILGYLNGVATTSRSTGFTAGMNFQSNQFSAIGRDVRYTGVDARHFTGGIAETRVYNRVLTATEIAQNFNATRGKYGV